MASTYACRLEMRWKEGFPSEAAEEKQMGEISKNHELTTHLCMLANRSEMARGFSEPQGTLYPPPPRHSLSQADPQKESEQFLVSS